MKFRIKYLAKQLEKIVADNSPAILTGIGVTGVVATAYLTGKASMKAQRILDKEIQQDRSFKTDVALVWKLYIPPAAAGAATCTCIVMANRIGTRRAAALAAAYSVSEKAFTEYREKVVEQIGKNKEQKIQDELAQERVKRNEGMPIVISGDETKVLCHDAFSNQFFYSDMESLRKAQNDVNAQILHADFATVSDFYHYVNSEGLQPTSVSGEMGWNTDKMLELHFSTVLYKDKTPCISVDFATVPARDPWRFC